MFTNNNDVHTTMYNVLYNVNFLSIIKIKYRLMVFISLCID